MKPTNVWCVGRNYADHAKELGNSVPQSPMIFLKSGSCVVESGQDLVLASWLGPVHHEVELALIFDQHLQVSRGAVALDLTAREIQNGLKSQGHPWTLAKSFPQACPVGSSFPIEQIEALQKDGSLQLFIDEELRQRGSFKDMIFPMKTLIEYVRSHFPVQPGDLLLTGTPAGVGPLKAGNTLRAEIPGRSIGRWKIG